MNETEKLENQFIMIIIQSREANLSATETMGLLKKACKEAGLKFVPSKFAMETYLLLKMEKHRKSAHGLAFTIDSQIKEIELEE